MGEQSKISIIPVSINELEEIQHISKTTFVETFAAVNTDENMQHYLNENLSLDSMKKEITNPFSQFFFAKVDNKLIGYLKINFPNSQTDKSFPESLEIERIYVLKEFHQRGIGRLLMEKAISVAKENKYNAVWLGGWEHNLKAINFYKKQNFVEFGSHVFMLGDDKQIDILMKLNLN